MDDAGGSTIKHIYITIIDNMLIKSPRILGEQIAIRNIFLLINKYITGLSIELKKLYDLKTGLMQDLLSGKVRVSKLLEKQAEAVV